jgi:acyl carrier protein
MSVQDRFIKIVCEQLGAEEDRVKLETSFVNDLGADSLDLFEMSLALEDEFRVEITEDQWRSLETVGQGIALIEAAPTVVG